MQKYLLIKKNYIDLKYYDQFIKNQIGGKEKNNTYDLTKLSHFEISRNNSILINKPNEKQQCRLDISGNLFIKLSSKYVPAVDGLIIDTNISSINHIDYEMHNTKKTFLGLFFEYQNGKYLISFDDSENKNIFANILTIFEKFIKKNGHQNVDENPRILDHHYGDLVLFTPKLLKCMQKGKKYYIVQGQHWSADYEGKNSIMVLDYENTHFDGENYLLYGTITNKMYGKERLESKLKSGSPFSIISSYGQDGYFYTGTGIDPVHLITKIRDEFELPKDLPKALLFNCHTKCKC